MHRGCATREGGQEARLGLRSSRKGFVTARCFRYSFSIKPAGGHCERKPLRLRSFCVEAMR